MAIARPAVGQDPVKATCTNLYKAELTDFVLYDQIDGRIFHPLTERNVQIRAVVGRGYDVSYTVRSAGTSAAGKTGPGSNWLYTNAYGFTLGTCTDGFGSRVAKHFDITGVTVGPAELGRLQTVTWSAGGSRNVTYTVQWIAAPPKVTTPPSPPPPPLPPPAAAAGDVSAPRVLTPPSSQSATNSNL